MSSHPISNFTSVTLLATKPINPFSHYFTLPSLHACMGPIPITWMRGGGAFRRGHQWVSLWYSGEVRYACCLESSYGINQTHICREVRDEWCMQSVVTSNEGSQTSRGLNPWRPEFWNEAWWWNQRWRVSESQLQQTFKELIHDTWNLHCSV